ncbi:MAG: hypothetical protein ACRYFU_11320 [Janthinobacterium lividum]
MKHLIVATSLALTLSFGTAFAQQTTDPQSQAEAGYHHHAPNPQRQAAMLTRRLNLTPEQTAKVEPILATRDQQMQALWQNQQLSEQDRHQQMHAIQQQTLQQMSGVLSPDQLTQLKSMHHHHEHRNGQNSDAGQAPTT